MRWRLPTKTASAVAVAAATMLCALALSPAALAAEPVAGAGYVGTTSQREPSGANRKVAFTVSRDGRRIEDFFASAELECTLDDADGEYYQEPEDRIRIAADGSFRSRYRYEVGPGESEDFLIDGSFTGDGTAATGFFRLRTSRVRPEGSIPPVDRCDSGRVTFEVSSEPPSCKGEPATIDARFESYVEGTPGRDVIVGSDGEQTIAGRDGRDLICGRGGADELRGGKKRDRLFGQRGGDALFGERGDDRLYGGRGEDSCRGGRGDDTVRSC